MNSPDYKKWFLLSLVFASVILYLYTNYKSSFLDGWIGIIIYIIRRLRNSRSSFASLNQNKEEFVQSTNSGMKSG